MSHTRAIVILSALALASTTALLLAGPLDPPAGPISPTFKTLAEVEPRIAINAANTPGDATSLFRITQRGSYYLTGNITGVVGKHGIEISAASVTLDLNGFDVLGVAGSLDGVSATTITNLRNIAVINGSVRNWGGDGVDLGSLAAIANCRVDAIRASGNAGFGVLTGSGCTVSNCVASSNAIGGLSAASGSTITNCSAYTNAIGISTDTGCTVTDCTASANTSHGISVSPGSTVSICSAASNAGNGINVNNSGVGGSCTISNCTAFSNTGNGISTGDGDTVADCTARRNRLDGIVCGGDCVIRGNTCNGNGNGGDGAGIHTTFTNNRIEGNNCTQADRGIDVDLAGNIIIRNTCADNTTNWVISGFNYYGPIIDRSGFNTPAVSGSSAASTLATTDPHANFTY